MSFFITEAETEKWLESETRILTMPDGSKQPYTDTKLTWRSLDYITDTSHITEKMLIDWAVGWSKDSGLGFEKTFPNMLVYTHRELRWQRGID